LACHLKVIDSNEEILDKFPAEHDPTNVVKILWNLYQRFSNYSATNNRSSETPCAIALKQ
jgi:hypothetical protein